MDSWHSCAHTILLHCIGSDRYRQSTRGEFGRSVRNIDVEPLVSILSMSHLAGVFDRIVAHYSELKDCSNLLKVRDQLRPELVTRAIFNQHLLAELIYFSQQLKERKCDAELVILKGISYWNTLYSNSTERQVRDLDLLIDKPEVLEKVCLVCEELGYQNLGFRDPPHDYQSHLYTKETYSLPPFRIVRHIDIAAEDIEDVKTALDRKPDAFNLIEYEEGRFGIVIDLEFHKAIFTLSDGSFAHSEAAYYQPSNVIDGVFDMTTSANLAYVATKFIFDAQFAIQGDEGGMKCLKLAADFIHLLLNAGQAHLTEAIQIAKKWGALQTLLAAIGDVRELVPEVRVSSLDSVKVQENYIDELIFASLPGVTNGP